MNALDELIKARSLLVLDHTFWGMLAMKLKLREEPLCETAATNGEYLYVNPDYISKLSLSEIIGLEAHEVMHCAMGDLWRLEGRDAMIWNIAADYVNNDILAEAKFTLPEGALIDPQYKGKSKEEVYNILMKMASGSGNQPGNQPGGQGKQKGQGQGQGQNGKGFKYPDPGKCGSVFQPANAQQAKEMETEWKTAVAQAAQVSQGTIPANLRRMINDEVLDPPLPWHVLLRDFVERTARNDYNWNRPNRRYLQQNIILPGMLSDELPAVVVAIDTSGSIGDKELSRFSAEASAILGSYKTHIHVLHCDAIIQSHDEYNTDELPLKLEAKGGGGTDFRPVFDFVAEQGITPSCLVYLTDMYGTFPEDEPEYPVMWVTISKDIKGPWGETIPLQI